MARPRTPIGTFGQIYFEKAPGGRARAFARFHDQDGQLRRVQVTGSTPLTAERKPRPTRQGAGRAARVRIAVDKWHFVALANQMVTDVRQRVTREQLGRRGTTREQIWVKRRMLLTGANHLSHRQWSRLETTLAAEDPTKQIAAAWAVKERLRMLLGESGLAGCVLKCFVDDLVDLEVANDGHPD